MLKRLLFACLVTSTTLGVGCAASDPSTDDGDTVDDSDDSETGDDTTMDPAPCTPATDVPPLLDIAALMSAEPTGDIERAEDGTLYFVTHVENEAATIGRRVPCGEIEADWLSITAPIVDLEISSDNQLYLAGSGFGQVDELSARIYRLDLSDNTAFPENLVRDPGKVIRTLSAAPDGRVFFLEGIGSTFSVRVIDGYDVEDVLATSQHIQDARSVSVAPNGSLWVTGLHFSTYKLGRITFSSSTGAATMTSRTVPFPIYGVHADNAGGYYAVTDRNLSFQELVHGLAYSSDPVPVTGATAHMDGRFGFNVTGDASKLVKLLSGDQPAVADITLSPPLAPR